MTTPGPKWTGRGRHSLGALACSVRLRPYPGKAGEQLDHESIQEIEIVSTGAAAGSLAGCREECWADWRGFAGKVCPRTGS